MKFIDLHCDTLMQTAVENFKGDLFKNKETSVSFEKMKEGDVLAQFFAIYLDKKENFEKIGIFYDSDEEYIYGRINYMNENIDKYSDIVGLARNYSELKSNEKSGKMSVFLTMEEGRAVDGSLEKLKDFYDNGIRLITLTWNYENCFGYPNSFKPEIMEKGLKPFGKEAIQYMEELGMLVDISHLSDGGIYDCLDILKKPFVASHSNARALANHPRNLTDDMIRSMASKGSVSGLNFCPIFLDLEQLKNRNVSSTSVSVATEGIKVYSKIEDMVNHLNYMKNKGGEDFPALGSDLDGIKGELEIDSVEKIQLLFDALRNNGWTESQIEKVAYKNVERVIKETMK